MPSAEDIHIVDKAKNTAWLPPGGSRHDADHPDEVPEQNEEAVGGDVAPPTTLQLAVWGLPPELKEQDRWAAWRWERRDGRWTKPPRNPATGYYARNNDPDTWSSFEAALGCMRQNRLSGVGFMFHPDDPFAGVDLDKCRDLETGEIEAWALEIVKELDSYTEVSPSGSGLKVFVRGVLPAGRRRKGRIEMYDRGRFSPRPVITWRVPRRG